MNLFLFLKSKIKFTALAFVFLAVLISYSPPSNHRAEASTDNWVYELGGFLKSSYLLVENFAIRAYQYFIFLKESVLDGLAWKVINIVLQQMSRSIITWINSGFNGSPAFIQDFEKFMLDTADKVAGNLIWGSELRFLCSPFQLNIRLALDLQYRDGRDYNAQCTLSKVVDNVERFMNGDFLAGGWNGWFQMTNRPTNNPYGALLLAQQQLSLRINNAKVAETNIAAWGKGLLSQKECVTVEDESGGHSKCPIVTPGTAIENQLNSALDLPMGRLKVADEINEILGALFTQLTYQMLGGAGGLLGLTKSGFGGGSGNYFDAVAQETTNLGTTFGGNPIEGTLRTERNYYFAKQAAANLLEGASRYKVAVYGEESMCHPGTLPPDLQQSYIAVLSDVALSLQTINRVEDMMRRYDAAANQPELQNQIMMEYMNLMSSGYFHSPSDATQVELEELPNLQQKVDAFRAQVDAACSGNGGGP